MPVFGGFERSSGAKDVLWNPYLVTKRNYLVPKGNGDRKREWKL